MQGIQKDTDVIVEKQKFLFGMWKGGSRWFSLGGFTWSFGCGLKWNSKQKEAGAWMWAACVREHAGRGVDVRRGCGIGADVGVDARQTSSK